jgi:hypothetical protein
MKWQCTRARRFGVLAAYQELTSKQELWLAVHRARCSDCAVFLDEIRSTLASIPKSTYHRAGTAFLESLWPRIAAGLSTKPPLGAKFQRRWSTHFPAGRRIGYAFAFAAVMLTVGIVIGRYFTPVSEDERQIAEQRVAQIKAEKELLDQIHRTREYLDRTRTLLLGILNRDPTFPQSDLGDIRKEQEVSKRLVLEGRGLRAELTGDHQGLQRLLIEEIEALLIQLTNLEEYRADAEIRRIQNRVEQRGILLKIAIEDMKIAEQEERVSAAKQIF